MSRFRWLRKAVRVTALTLTLVLGVVYIGSAAPPQFQYGVEGSVLLHDRSLCWYNNQFFGKMVSPLVEQYDSSGTLIGSDNGNQVGWYQVQPNTFPSAPLGTKIRITCEGASVEQVVTQADIDRGRLDMTLPNSRPLSGQLVATLNGQPVRGVPPGATVSVSVAASDPDGDAVHYQWGATDGVTSTLGATATWRLPNSRGLHFLYVLLSDGKGGYTEKQLAISTDGGVVPAIGAFSVLLPSMVRSGSLGLRPGSPGLLPVEPADHVPAGSHFLTYSSLTNGDQSLDDRSSACAYYRDIGAVTGCAADGHPNGYAPNYASFANWKTYWGFGSSANEASAKYANLADLNLQRDMHTLSRPAPGGGTDVASYVCNYPNPASDTTLSNARLGNNLVACVAFEYSRTVSPTTGLPYNGGQPFTKFVTFGPDGNLLLSVNLDGRGEKFMPQACVACHGGQGYSGHYGSNVSTDPAFGAQFIPYDLDNYQFSTEPGFHRTDQEAQLRALNQFVLETGPYTPTVELINGWYPTPASSFDGAFVPLAWQGPGREDLYRAVVKPDCRMCHLALPVGQLAFESYDSFALQDFYIGTRVCGAWTPSSSRWYAMPNAKQTFDRFWTSQGSPQGMDAPTTLLQFLVARGTLDFNNDPVTTCALPSWLP